MSKRKTPRDLVESLVGELTKEVLPPSKQKEESKPPYDQKYTHVTYRLQPGLHQRVKDIAAKEEIRVNELVRYIITSFCDDYEKGRISLPIDEIQFTEKRLVNQ